MIRYAFAAVLLWLLAAVSTPPAASWARTADSGCDQDLIFAAAAVGLAFIMGAGGLVSLGHAAAVGIGAYSPSSAHRNGVAESGDPAAGSSRRRRPIRADHRSAGASRYSFTIPDGHAPRDRAPAPGGGRTGRRWAAARDCSFPNAASCSACRCLDALGIVLAGVRAPGRELRSLRDAGASSFGRALRAMRQNSAIMERLGVSRFRLQLKAVVIAGALAGPAGVLLANLLDAALSGGVRVAAVRRTRPHGRHGRIGNACRFHCRSCRIDRLRRVSGARYRALALGDRTCWRSPSASSPAAHSAEKVGSRVAEPLLTATGAFEALRLLHRR